MRATKLLFVVALLTVAIAAVPAAHAVAPVVHVLTAGSSAQFLQLEVAAVNDIAPTVSACSAGVGAGASQCTIHHWSIKTSDCPLCAQLSDNRVSGSTQPALQAGNIWVVWVISNTTGATTDIWSDVSVDSTVGVRTFLARAAGGGVGTTLDLSSTVTSSQKSDNANSYLLFKYGSGTAGGTGTTGTGTCPSPTADACDDEYMASDAYTAVAVNDNRLTGALTDIRAEDAKLATKRDMKPMNQDQSFTGLGYGSAGSQLVANVQIISGTGSNAGVTQAQPVAFALPGFTDPFYSTQTVPTTITTLPVGESPIVIIANRSNANGLGAKVSGSYYYNNVYDYVLQGGAPVTKLGKLFFGKDLSGDAAAFFANGFIGQPGDAVAAGQVVSGANGVTQINDPAADGSLKVIYNTVPAPASLAAGDWVTLTNTIGPSGQPNYYDGTYQISSVQSGGNQGPSGNENSFKIVPDPFNSGQDVVQTTPATAGWWTAAQNFPINVIIRESLSGTYNTFEFSSIRIFGGDDGSDGYSGNLSYKSQDANFDSGGNATYLCQGNGADVAAGGSVTAPCEISADAAWFADATGTVFGTRTRAIGTGEETNGAGSAQYPSGTTHPNGVLHTQDGLGYTFFSFSNVSSLATEAAPNGPAGYLSLDNVDPLFASYNGSEPGQPGDGGLPTCSVALNGSPGGCLATDIWSGGTTFPNLRNGTYRSWSLLRALCDTANVHCLKSSDAAGLEGLIAKEQDEIHGGTSVPDFLPFSDDGSFGPSGGQGDASYYRSYGTPGYWYAFDSENIGLFAGPSNVSQEGGDVGGCITAYPLSDSTGTIGSPSGVAPYGSESGQQLLQCNQ